MHHRNFNAILGIALSFPFTTSAQNDTTALEPVIVNEDRADEFSEGSGKYNTSGSRSATGLRLSNQETPQTLSTITNQQIQDQDTKTVRSALENSPGISVENRGAGNHIVQSRGHEVDNYQLDGISTDLPGYRVMDDQLGDSIMYDRIEIVRGANSLMGGSGTPGASVNLVRKHANSNRRETSLDLGIGRFQEKDISLDHSQPLNQDGSLRGRVILHHNRKHTFMDRESLENNTIYGILDVDITSNDTVSLGFSQEHNKDRNPTWGGLPDFYDDGTRISWPRGANFSPNWSNMDSRAKSVFIESTNDINSTLSIKTKAGHRATKSKSKLLYVGTNSVTQEEGITGIPDTVGKYDYDNTADYFHLQADGKFQAWQQTHEFIIGISYNRDKIKELQFENPEESSIASIEDYNIWAGDFPEPEWEATPATEQINDKKMAVFASSRLKMNDDASLIIGGRLSNWEYRDTGDQGTASVHLRKTGVWTPYAGILYNVTPQNTLYTSYTDIFSQQTERDIDGKPIGPSRGKSYEIGWKGNYAEGGLQTQVSLFRSTQDNLAQESGENIPDTSPPERAYYGAQGATVNGFELQAEGSLTPSWKISAGYTQWRGKDAQGTPINTNTPRKQFTLFSRYDLSPHVQGLTLGGGVRWQNRTYIANIQHEPTEQILEYDQGSYAVAELMAKYQINRQSSIQVNATNIFDKKFVELDSNQHLYGEPFIIKTSLQYSF